MGVYKAWSEGARGRNEEGARGRNEERKDTSEVADTIMAWEEIATFHGNPFRGYFPTIRFFFCQCFLSRLLYLSSDLVESPGGAVGTERVAEGVGSLCTAGDRACCVCGKPLTALRTSKCLCRVSHPSMIIPSSITLTWK